MKVSVKDLEEIYGIENEFITYGSNKFDKNKFDPIKNMDFIKPHGGLWSSPINSEWGWKDWCINNGFREEKLSNWFKFRLRKDSIILIIDNLNDLKELYEIEKVITSYGDIFPDFEKLSKSFDGILLTDIGELATRLTYPGLYMWDCESLLVLNPEVIEVVEE
jgi:hypothetical protein